jgi:hypothetical protein
MRSCTGYRTVYQMFGNSSARDSSSFPFFGASKEATYMKMRVITAVIGVIFAGMGFLKAIEKLDKALK